MGVEEGEEVGATAGVGAGAIQGQEAEAQVPEIGDQDVIGAGVLDMIRKSISPRA